MDDDFEYDIRFSSSTNFYNKNSDPTSDDEFMSRYKIIQSEEPVIVLLGWGGCKERHLSKYTSIYGKHGCTTLMYIAPMEMLISVNPRKILTTNAKKLVNLLEDMDLIEKPLFFHCFSNGGALMYDLIKEVLLKRDEIYNVRGCIFDSGPTEFGLLYMCRTLLVIFQNETFKKYVNSIVIFLYLYILFLYNWMLSYFYDNQDILKKISLWHSLVLESNICPQLFLFSKEDTICNYKSIQKFIELRKNKDVKVDFYMWNKTPHVSHFRYFPDQYARIILDFVTRNLE